MSRLRRLRLASDEGVTMMELLVYSILGVFVLVIVGSLIINGMRGQSSVTSITSATTTGQLAASSIQADIRNASAIKVTVIGNDQLVVARVARGNDSAVAWKCVAWYYSATTKEIRTKTSAAAVTAPSSGTLSSWTLIASSVKPKGTVVFAGDAKQLTMTYTVDAGTTKPVPITSSATSRNQSGVSAPCF